MSAFRSAPFLCTGSHDYTDPAFGLITKSIQLEAGCWIAAMCFVGPGVVIGPGTVCAAGAVVTQSAPPYCLVAGNPATVVRTISMQSKDQGGDQPFIRHTERP